MQNNILNNLLKEYEQKKLNAEIDLEKRKQDLYKLIPKIEKIDIELNSCAINSTKTILTNPKNSSTTIENLKEKIKQLNNEKKQLLKENNYSLDYLKPFYECNICKDTGFITDNNYKTIMCNCLKQKLLDISFNKSNLSNLNKENFENFNELIFNDTVNYQKYKFNISPRKNIINIKNKCINFINNFDNPNCKNLLFIGNTGLRKNIYVKLYCLRFTKKRKDRYLSNCPNIT